MTMIKVDNLLKLYRNESALCESQKIIFKGVGNKDVYNITAPFSDGDKRIIAGRVENRSDHFAEIGFFEQVGDEWHLISDTPKMTLQDPFFTNIGDKLVLGGVEIFNKEGYDRVFWRTVFYKGDSIYNLERFAVGPDGMKDIRLIELKNKQIGLFTRPQGEIGGRGKIGFKVIDNLEQLKDLDTYNAPLLDLFFDDEWGGANEIHLLEGNKIGVLGHIAKFSGNNIRHYYPIVFCIDLDSNYHTSAKIIAERANFEEGPSKRDDLIDVLFSGGIIRNGESSELYVGVSDCEAHMIKIKDPFMEYECK